MRARPVCLALLALLMVVAGCSGQPNNSNITVSGRVLYEDKQYDESGFTGVTTLKPVRYAVVQVVSSPSGVVIASAVTNSIGGYDATFQSGYYSAAYVRVLAASDASSNQSVRVGVAYGGGPTISVVSSTFPISVDDVFTRDMDIELSGGAAGAYNILDIYLAAGEFVNSVTGGYPPSMVNVYWHEGNTRGTYRCDVYDMFNCPLGAGIYVLSIAASDTDEFDDDVLLHEYGHELSAQISRDESPGGWHTLADNDLDLRLAWSEGWGGYFPGAVKKWLRLAPSTQYIVSSTLATPYSRYVDTDIDGIYLSIDFAIPGAWPYFYSSSEVAVAKILLTLDSRYSSGEVLDVYTSTFFTGSANPANLETFWDGWLDAYAPSATEKTTVLEPIFSDRKVYYRLDAYEALDDDVPNPLREAVVGTLEEHYLYNSTVPDMDYVAFDATPGMYLIETYCAMNGADTYIVLEDTDGVELDNDDNTYNSIGCAPNYFSKYLSRISYDIAIANTYYVGVSTSSSGREDTGRYGTYTLSIKKQ